MHIKNLFGKKRDINKLIEKNETVTLGWCDNGLTAGKFVEGLVSTLLTGVSENIIFHSMIRVDGNQIGRQRQNLFDFWADEIKTDWLLWVDSDIAITTSSLKKLWENADKDFVPVISGLYYIIKDTKNNIPIPRPCLFKDIDSKTLQYLDPIPKDKLIQCDIAGMGLVLMHKSIVSKLRNKYLNRLVFAEEVTSPTDFVSEDVVFFRKLKSVGIQLYAHTGATATHLKQVPLTSDYYAHYWNNQS
jgi:hypothetical protein